MSSNIRPAELDNRFFEKEKNPITRNNQQEDLRLPRADQEEGVEELYRHSEA